MSKENSTPPEVQLNTFGKGIPYSVSEAREVIGLHKMHQYHKELMLFLCDEVERLQHILNPEPIKKGELLQAHNLMEHLFISSFVNTFPNLNFNKSSTDPRAKELCDATELQIVLLVNGIPLDVNDTVREWDKQSDKLVEEKAAKLIQEKIGDAQNRMSDLLESVKKQMEEKMEKAGFTIPEEY